MDTADGNLVAKDLAASASFYRRPLPEDLVAFASAQGRQLFREALGSGGMEGWFALSEQFHTQADPAFCGLGTLVVVLNALEIDPGRIWKGPWRWYGEDLLDCCLPLEEVKRKGVTIDELACLARCNGAISRVVRGDEGSVEDLRREVRAATASPRGPVLVAAYSRALLGQTGDGHFSPIAGYHAERDLVLILDVARFKYPPHWVPLPALWEAMKAFDPATGRARGFIVLDRGVQRALPLFFRLSAGDGVGALVTALLEQAPALLAAAPTDSGAALVAGWVKAVETQLRDKVCRGMGCQSTVPARLPPEHRAAVEQLLAELRQTAVHQAVVASRPPGQTSQIPDEVLATLLLALPEAALAQLPAATRQTLRSLREGESIGPALAEEIAALREQMSILREWQSLTSP